MVNEIVFVKSSHRREQEEKSTEGEDALPFSAMCARDAVSFFSSCEKAAACNDKGEDIDILEQNIRELSPYLLKILLQDKTTGRFIRWACDEYTRYGEAYAADKEILPELITGKNTKIIQPRTAKSKAEQQTRTRKAAEVFTPGWICNEMLNHCDEEWFGHPNVFNFAEGKSWRPVDGRILFADDGKRKKPAWQRYVDSRCLEITCGEAPFLVGRYDTTTGEFFPIEKRIGVLDRKLRVVHENTDSEAEWFKWTKRAFEATYGYEYQGDNLLLARENLLLTFIDNYQYKFRRFPTIAQLKQMANIIAWNVWQMDGLKECTPFAAAEASQLELFDDLPTLAFPIICRLKDWRNKRVLFFRDLKGDKKMKFDVIIGNPPYQLEDKGNNTTSNVKRTSAIPVYPHYVEEAKKIAQMYISMIMPSRWMTGGKGLDSFRENNIKDKRFLVIHDFENDKEVFPNNDVGGGVMYFIWDRTHCGQVKYYKHNKNSIDFVERYLDTGQKIVIRDYYSALIVSKIDSSNSFSSIVSARKPFGLGADITRKSPESFSDEPMKEFNIKFYAWSGTPIVKYTTQGVLKNLALMKSFKVFISKTADPPMRFGRENKEILRKPFLGYPNEACSETYLTIGCCSEIREVKSIEKYIKTKFLRFLVLQKKKTQNVSREVFELVPLQDFTENSDIDWSKSIPEIDAQLYQKYGLNKEEIDFIESVIKPME